MDLSLSLAEAALQAKARRFCDQVLSPLEDLVAEAGHLPHDRRADLDGEAEDVFGRKLRRH